MKKRIFLVIIGLFLLTRTVDVKALTVKPSGPTSIAPGQTQTVNIIVEGASEETKVSAIEGELSYDTNVLTLDSVSKIINWTQTNGMNNFSLGDPSHSTLISTSPVTIYALSFTAKSNASAGNTIISINNPACTDEEDADIAGVVGGSLTMRVKSTINTLADLSITGATISFSSNITTYNVTIDAPNATISATPTDTNATVTGTGVKTLNYGANKFDVVVTSEAGTTKTYTINVTRTDNRSNNNNLKSLTTNPGTISFDSSKTTYEIEIDSDVDKITIAAELADTKASFVPNFGPRTVNLKIGLNTILIKVNSEKGETKTYTLNVTKKDNRSSINTLKTLSLSKGTIVFQEDILEYQTTVAFTTTEIEVNYTPTDTKAKVEVTGNKDLVVGENTIIIKVTAENETTKEYKIIVKRLNENEKLPSSNSYLSQLTIANYTISFNKNTLNYDLKIKKEKSLTITAIPEDSDSKVNITGNANLDNGSIIKIVVTSLDGSSRTYQINIIKDSGINPIIIYAAIGGVAVIILVVTIVLVSKSKKNKNLNTTPKDLGQIKEVSFVDNNYIIPPETTIPQNSNNIIPGTNIPPANNNVIQPGTNIPQNNNINNSGSNNEII